MPEELSTHVGLTVLALLCYSLLFCSTRELSLTTLLFCDWSVWSAGELAAIAGGAARAAHNATGGFTSEGHADHADHADTGFAPAPARAVAAARAAGATCSSILFSTAVREACWNYTAYFAQDEPASSSP